MTYSLIKYQIEEDQLTKKHDEYLSTLIDNLEKKQAVVESFSTFCAIDGKSCVSRKIYSKIINLVKKSLTTENAKEIFPMWAQVVKRRRSLEMLDDYVLTTLSFNEPSLVAKCFESLFEEFGEYFLKFVILFEGYREFDFLTEELRKMVKEGLCTWTYGN